MNRRGILKTAFFSFLLSIGWAALARAEALTIPKFNFVQPAASPNEVSFTLQMLMILIVLSLAPAILLMMTSFARIAIVLAFVKRALGFQQIPNQIVIALALFLTAIVMMPIWDSIRLNAYEPYVVQKITQEEALQKAKEPIREFMLRQTREKDIALFVYFAKLERPRSPKDVPLYILAPAFMISELKTAFIYGFLIYVPFLVIDLVVASILVSMGMLVLPPIMISVPLKILLFVLVDGWYLIVRSLLGSFY